MPRGEILLESPPEIPEVASGGFQTIMTFLPMGAMAASSGLMVLGGGASNPLMMVSSGGMALSMGGKMLGQLGRSSGDRKFKLNGQRRDYYRYLALLLRRLADGAAGLRE